ncbi:hypothetical protein AC249_AIPGENE14046 [Exaiptasia diaphana]|nr:hypothetical protein AC249_AIPGENE14046 [Exaiptasia diaphana]
MPSRQPKTRKSCPVKPPKKTSKSRRGRPCKRQSGGIKYQNREHAPPRRKKYARLTRTLNGWIRQCVHWLTR